MTLLSAEAINVTRGPHRIHAELVPGPGAPVVLMHGFPDNLHLYDHLLPHLVGRAPVVRFDFLGWGRSDKPAGYPYTATNQIGDVAAVIDAVSALWGTQKVILVAHDASGPPAIEWALANPGRVQRLVLLNTYYNRTAGLKRPPAIALYSTPLLRNAARAAARRWPGLDRRMFTWQVGKFIQDPAIRGPFVAELYEQFDAARPAFWRLNEDLIGTVIRGTRRVGLLRNFTPPVRIVFGAKDRYLTPRVARRFAELFPNSDLHLLPDAGHYVQVDEPRRVADLLLASGYGN
ncbi:hydrolase [Rhizocola hellebori]|uniref:Hydrolase n=1 Tax=Rhizocola hellebori TaxID=1392758 RepID=A0A8J3VE38_9ACTN|nr:alpha/beta hydrolase [Rhizocola hellebori]GIH02981.1 hydrolase [Rhizocola hellebori]